MKLSFIDLKVIKSAFDNAHPRHMSWAFLDMGVHPKLVAAMVYEQAGMRIQLEFEHLDMSSQEAIRMSACIAQGGVHSTYSWNALIGYIMQLMLPGWFSKKFGVELNDSFITHAVWSDNT